MSISSLTEPRTNTNATRQGWFDPAALMRIKNLQLRARRLVEGFYNGLHRSPYHGFSSEFSEYRQYSPGDDLRYLDWKLYARSDRYYIKQFEDETNRRCYFVVDQSKSMAFGSLPYNKAEYTTTLVATLAYYLTLQRDSVGLLTFDERLRDYLPARFRHGQLRHLLAMLDQAPSGSSTELHEALDIAVGLVKKRGLVVVVSDFLIEPDTLTSHFAKFLARGHELLLLRVLDPKELDLDFRAASQFVDAETGRKLYIDPAKARADYRQRFDKHQQKLERIAADQGADFVQLVTSQPLEYALHELLSMQLRRGKASQHRLASHGLAVHGNSMAAGAV